MKREDTMTQEQLFRCLLLLRIMLDNICDIVEVNCSLSVLAYILADFIVSHNTLKDAEQKNIFDRRKIDSFVAL